MLLGKLDQSCDHGHYSVALASRVMMLFGLQVVPMHVVMLMLVVV